MEGKRRGQRPLIALIADSSSGKEEAVWQAALKNITK